MIAFIIILSIIIIGSLIAMILIMEYNRITLANNKINDAEIKIDEKLRSMYDTIIRTINIIEKVSKDELKQFKEIKNLKSDTLTNFEMDRKLHTAHTKLIQTGDDNPKLEKNEEYIKLKEDLRKTEENLLALRSFYNKYVSEYNLLIKSFPSSIIAKISKYNYKNQYDGKDLNDDILNDFKL